MPLLAWGSGNKTEDSSLGTTSTVGRNLQDGLFEIASQACHILVQVDNSEQKHRRLNDPGGAPSTGANQDVLLILPPQFANRSNVSKKNTRKVSTATTGTSRIEATAVSYEDDLDFWDQSGFMMRNDIDDPYNKWGSREWCKPSCIPISFILILIVLVVLLPLVEQQSSEKQQVLARAAGAQVHCNQGCTLELVESIPVNLTYPSAAKLHKPTYLAWRELVERASSRIEIAALYWSLREADVGPDPTARLGEQVLDSLLRAGADRGIELRIANNAPSHLSPNADAELLVRRANAQLRNLSFPKLIGADGVLHTKLWLVDRRDFYVGSANMDWRALTQVKELGLVGWNCSCLALDLAKIFDTYWKVGTDGQVPDSWPKDLATTINVDNPLNLSLTDGTAYRSFIGAAPPKLLAPGRTNDIDGLLHCIQTAEKFVYISVMDFVPIFLYSARKAFWPVIDDALRAAALERGILVRFLISDWPHSRPSQAHFLKSLTDLTNAFPGTRVQVKLFRIPVDPSYKVPYTRVNHNKYMVTDRAAYIGTSNWSADYFVNTAGIGFILEDAVPGSESSLRQQLESVFERDWDSEYARPLNGSCQPIGARRQPVVPPLFG